MISPVIECFKFLGVNVGRKQKKKTSSYRKKKRTIGTKLDSQQQKIASEKKSTLFSGAATDTNKAPMFTQRPVSSAPVRPTAGRGVVGKAMQFLREVRVELKKVTWPTRKQAIGSTIVVLVLVMIISFFLGAVDVGLRQLVRIILQ